MKKLLAGIVLSLAMVSPVLADPISEVTPVPSPTNLISTSVPEQKVSPIEITKFWHTTMSGRCLQGVYLFGTFVCTRNVQYPFIHWNFINNGDKVATAIRFQVTEVSAFGETLSGVVSDLTGTFSPGIKIESRARYHGRLRGNGTHWEIRVLKILWSDGTIWERF